MIWKSNCHLLRIFRNGLSKSDFKIENKDLKGYMEETYGIHDKFLYLENKIFRDMDHIKQLRIYPPENGKCDLIVIYEIEEPEQLSQNGHYLSIDLGLHNLSCWNIN